MDHPEHDVPQVNTDRVGFGMHDANGNGTTVVETSGKCAYSTQPMQVRSVRIPHRDGGGSVLVKRGTLYVFDGTRGSIEHCTAAGYACASPLIILLG